jgi:hypothetical protein
MLDTHSGTALIEGYLAARHEHLVRERQLHRLATEARSARGGGQEVRPRRRVLPRLIPATR